MGSPSGPLTDFQVVVARAFLFTSPGRGVVADALTALETEAGVRGWTVRRVRVSQTFARIVVAGVDDESVLVDLAVDATPRRPATMSLAGPTLDLEEFAGRKVVALFDRAEARDFADVLVLAARYGRERLLELAAEADAGFDAQVLADMLGSLERFTDAEIPAPNPAAVRAFAAEWAQELRSQPPTT